jgi:hypothetical protein
MKMKRIFTFWVFIAICFQSQLIFGQCSPDVSFTSPGIYPDTLPEGTVGQSYAQDITFVMPIDTSGFNFTNFEIVSISLPVGLTWICNNDANGCNYNPQINPYGCVHVSGTPLLAGDYTVTVSVIATLEVIGSIPSSFDVFMHVNPAQTITTNDGFTMSGFEGCAPLTVEFTNNNPGLVQYAWDFGNGNQSNLENPAPQVYASPGDYIVQYQAWNDLTTVEVYTLSGVQINSMSGYGEGFPSYENADAYYKIFEDGVLFAQSSIIADQNPPVSWITNNVLDPTKTYTIEIWESDAGEFGFGGDDYMGIHTLNFAGCNGCAAGSANINYSISYVAIPPTPFVSSVDTIHVFGVPGQPSIVFDSLTHTVSTDSIANSIQWYFEGSPIVGATAPTYVIQNSGSYALIAFNAGGCVAFSDTIQAVYCTSDVDPIITETTNELLVSNSNGYTVQWYFGGNAIPNAVSNSLPISVGGPYSVILTSPFGCSYESTVFNATLGINEVKEKPFAIFPNPATDKVFIKIENGQQYQLRIQDLLGRIIVDERKIGVSIIETEVFENGIYIFEIEIGNIKYSEKIFFN